MRGEGRRRHRPRPHVGAAGRGAPGPGTALTWLRCCCSACRLPPPPPAGHGSPVTTKRVSTGVAPPTSTHAPSHITTHPQDAGTPSHEPPAPCTPWCAQDPLPSCPSPFWGRAAAHLVVQHHHVVRPRVQPRVHGFANAADLLQRRGVQVGPAEIQHLGEELGRRGWWDTAGGHIHAPSSLQQELVPQISPAPIAPRSPRARPTLGCSLLMSCLRSDRLKSFREEEKQSEGTPSSPVTLPQKKKKTPRPCKEPPSPAQHTGIETSRRRGRSA